ncbi:MAG: hypothetical protein U0892_10440 [Pirellulales bacterium]
MRTQKSIRALLAGFVLGVGAMLPMAQAQSDKAVAVVSIAPVEKLMKDVSYVTQAAGVPEFSGFANLMIKQYTNGLDTSRPAGVVVTLVDNQPLPLAFLPLKNREAFFQALAAAGVIPDELGNGMFSFDAGGRSIFAKDAGQWLFISQQEDDLAKLPSNPAALLRDMPTKYDLGIELNVQAFPEELRQLAIDQMKEGFERSLAEQTGQSDEERAAAEEMGKASMAQLERVIKETDKVLLGWNSDPKQQRVALTVAAQFTEGSELAKQSELLSSLTSSFTGLLIPEAAVNSRFTSPIAESDKAVSKNNIRNGVAQMEKQIDDSGSLPSPAKDALKKFVKGVAGVLSKTIDGGKLDGALSVDVEEGDLSVVLGGAVADGRALEKEVKDLVKALGSGPDVPTVEFDYAKHKNVSLHKVHIPIQSDDPIVEKLFGDELTLVIGTADKAFYISLEPEDDDVIKEAIDRAAGAPSAKVTPGELIVEVGQLLEFAQELQPNPMLDIALEAIKEYDGKDSIRLNSTAIPRGGMYELSIDEGVLKAIGVTAKAGQAGNRGGF